MFADMLGRRTHQGKKKTKKTTSPEEERWNIYDELDRYHQEAIFDRRRSQPLERGKENESRLRRLAPLVRKFLLPPPRAVPERVFMEIGNISDS